jgi:hypothetical protein
VVAVVAAVVAAAAATAAPAPTVAVATISKPNVLFNFMAAFLNCCGAIVTYRYGKTVRRYTR